MCLIDHHNIITFISFHLNECFMLVLYIIYVPLSAICLVVEMFFYSQNMPQSLCLILVEA